MKAAHGSVFKYGDNVDTDVIIPIRKNLPHTVWKISIKISLKMYMWEILL